jgi:hypothetical protein
MMGLPTTHFTERLAVARKWWQNISSHLAARLLVMRFGGNVRLSGIGTGIQFATCNVYSRREFAKAKDSAAAEASQAIAFYKLRYAVKNRAKALNPEDRRQTQMKEAKPIWGRFCQWLDGILPNRRLPKNAFCKANTYMTKNWEVLILYVPVAGYRFTTHTASDSSVRDWS